MTHPNSGPAAALSDEEQFHGGPKPTAQIPNFTVEFRSCPLNIATAAATRRPAQYGTYPLGRARENVRAFGNGSR